LVGGAGDTAATTGGAEAMRINSAGNVGIGTTTPVAKLEVAGQVKITGGTPGAGRVLTSDANGLATWLAPAVGSESDPKVTAYATGNNNYIPKANSGSSTLSPSSIYDNGNVGIGTTNPYQKLDVNGNALFGNLKESFQYGGDATVRINNLNASSWYYARVAGVAAGGFGVKNGDNNVYMSNLASDSDFGSGSKSIALNPSGNVGIGTTNPYAKLHVVGDGAIFMPSAWSDGYVAGIKFRNDGRSHWTIGGKG
jgi:hypothetical protein